MRRKVLNAPFFLCSLVSLFFSYSELSANTDQLNSSTKAGFESSFKNENETVYIDLSRQDFLLGRKSIQRRLIDSES
ncbi:hypothetical protein AB674_15405 [Flavobacterium sp. ABG]|jgi:hypothetical protein|nr:hypothetical protein AB674_15405 [Flavobacterium sp. ABG]